MYIDVAAYLPSSDCVTIYFLKDLATGKKKCKSSSLPELFYSHQSERHLGVQRASIWRAGYRANSWEGSRSSSNCQLSPWWAGYSSTASVIHRERNLHSDGWAVQELGPRSYQGAQQQDCGELEAYHWAWPGRCYCLQRLSQHLK